MNLFAVIHGRTNYLKTERLVYNKYIQTITIFRLIEIRIRKFLKMYNDNHRLILD